MGITVRTNRFVAGEQPALWWHGDDPVATTFFTVLSLAFPPGERFFIETLMGVVDQLPPQLAGEVRSFARQEANHAHQHLVFNRHMIASGPETTAIEQLFAARITAAQGFPPLLRVAFTAALEHLTTIIGRLILRDSRLFAGTSAEIQAFWKWHAVEEVEHKSVAFDVFKVLGASMSPFRRWQMRVRAMRAATRVLVSYAKIAGALLAQDDRSGARMPHRLLWFLLVSPGLYRRCLPDWFGFFLPGYHPTWVDDTRLLAAAEQDSSGAAHYPADLRRTMSGL